MWIRLHDAFHIVVGGVGTLGRKFILPSFPPGFSTMDCVPHSTNYGRVSQLIVIAGLMR